MSKLTDTLNRARTNLGHGHANCSDCEHGVTALDRAIEQAAALEDRERRLGEAVARWQMEADLFWRRVAKEGDDGRATRIAASVIAGILLAKREVVAILDMPMELPQ